MGFGVHDQLVARAVILVQRRCLLRVSGFGFRVSGFGFRVEVLGLRVQGSEFSV